MDYKSNYPEFLYVNEYQHDNEKIIDEFNETFNREVVPLYNGKTISGKIIYLGFQYYLKDKWDEFVERVKEETK
jgi:hypothetical protein|nr:MAG TPA: hypothetical protein [Caudoviricetes sp.]